jgi:hypothetical protein
MRITALNILLDPTGKAYLAELYGKVIENVQKSTISGALKNKSLSGDPTTGTVEASRYQNSASKVYGTARGAHAGDSVKAKPVTISIDVDREIIEELEAKDVKLYGVDGVLDRRSANHVQSMVRELEEAFFLEMAANAEIQFTPSSVGNTVAESLEEMFVALSKVRNSYVNGINRSLMTLILDPATYSSIRNYLDTAVQNANVNTAAESFGVFHGVKVYESIYLPAGVRGVLETAGSVAQPVMSNSYTAEKIELSNAYAVELFYSFGTKIVTPDLVMVWKYQLATPTIALNTNALTITPVTNAEVYGIYAKATGIENFLALEIDAEDLGTINLERYAAATPTAEKPFDIGVAYTITVIASNTTDVFKASAAQAADADVNWTATDGQ